MTVFLPPRASVNGAVARLLLLEARDPSNPFYLPAETLTSMQWMKLVLQNRLNHQPAQFLAPHAKSLTDIIRARSQFAGFGNYPHYGSELETRLQAILDIANNADDARSPRYLTFVQNGLTVANGPVIADPSLAKNSRSLGLFAWKTIGAPPPGGQFVKYKDIAGNSFYMLTA